MRMLPTNDDQHEAEWLNCDNPERMLQLARGRVSKQQLLLFNIACCRRVERHLPAANRGVLDLLERCADAEPDRDALEAARQALLKARSSWPISSKWESAISAVLETVSLALGQPGLPESPRRADHHAVSAVLHENTSSTEEAIARVRQAQTRLLRDIVGNPFRPIELDPVWLARNGGAVRRVAQGIYEGRHFTDLPILADALEDAGCDGNEILDHCRSGGEHVRGCRVIDLILGNG